MGIVLYQGASEQVFQPLPVECGFEGEGVSQPDQLMRADGYAREPERGEEVIKAGELVKVCHRHESGDVHPRRTTIFAD